MHYAAILEYRSVVSEVEAGPYHVKVLNPDESIANTGQAFASRAEARAFAEGLDMAARLSGHRVLRAGPEWTRRAI